MARDRSVPRRSSFWQTVGLLRAVMRTGDGRSGACFVVEVMANPFQFLQDVRAEAIKVTWPTRKETLITTGMVVAMVVVAAIFFVLVDQIVHFAVGLILGLGR